MSIFSIALDMLLRLNSHLYKVIANTM